MQQAFYTVVQIRFAHRSPRGSPAPSCPCRHNTNRANDPLQREIVDTLTQGYWPVRLRMDKPNTTLLDRCLSLGLYCLYTQQRKGVH